MADSVDAQAARRCHALFSSGSIGPCLEQLEQLQLRAAGSRSTQVQIEHNKLVCQYHAHGGGGMFGGMSELIWMAVVAGIMYMGHRNGMGPWQLMMLYNMLQGNRGHRPGFGGGFGGPFGRRRGFF